MARYTAAPRGGQRTWIYLISALLVVVVVVALIYGLGLFGKSEQEPTGLLPDVNVPEANEAPAPRPRPQAPPEPNLRAIAPMPVGEPNSRVSELIVQAAALTGAKPPKIIEARDILNEAFGMPMNVQQRAFVKEQLAALAAKWLFSREVLPEDKLCGTYTVKAGDRLSAIGDQFKVPYEILMQINNINRPEVLQAGGAIKVINGPFHARIYRSSFTMDLFLQKTFVRSFSVGLGKPGRETPTGLWVVKQGKSVV